LKPLFSIVFAFPSPSSSVPIAFARVIVELFPELSVALIVILSPSIGFGESVQEYTPLLFAVAVQVAPLGVEITTVLQTSAVPLAGFPRVGLLTVGAVVPQSMTTIRGVE
jgi:hypothetical protein